MFVTHILAGLTVGFVTAVWAYAEGHSLLAMLGFYVLSGNLGLALSAAVSLVGLPWQGHAHQAQEA